MHASLTDNVMFANASSAHGLADEVEAVLQDARDSLRRVDLFRCESILLKSHWVMAVMDQYTRRIIGFAVHAGDVDGSALCRTFNESISGQDWPKNISTDNDPLFQYHQWKANLRILEVDEIKSLPHVPMSHPFVERLIGSIRRELLVNTFFWTTTDLQNTLCGYQQYYNKHRTHSGRDGVPPVETVDRKIININQLSMGQVLSWLIRITGRSVN